LQKNQQGILSHDNSNLQGPRLLLQESYKGVDRALTPDESILHKIIIIIKQLKQANLNA